MTVSVRLIPSSRLYEDVNAQEFARITSQALAKKHSAFTANDDPSGRWIQMATPGEVLRPILIDRHPSLVPTAIFDRTFVDDAHTAVQIATLWYAGAELPETLEWSQVSD